MRSTSTAVVLALVLALAIRADACFSEGRRLKKMKDYEKRARELGISESDIQCLLKEGDKYQPKEHTIHGQVFKCYNDFDYTRHMVSAMAVCIGDLKPITIRKLADSDTEVEEEPDMPTRVLRRPIEPSSPMRKVAHWLGLQETVRGSCSCLSGCHYCCVNTGLSGDDLCFRIWCRGAGYCS